MLVVEFDFPDYDGIIYIDRGDGPEEDGFSIKQHNYYDWYVPYEIEKKVLAVWFAYEYKIDKETAYGIMLDYDLFEEYCDRLEENGEIEELEEYIRDNYQDLARKEYLKEKENEK